MTVIHIVMHHTLHKTNNILSKFLLFSPKQVKIASDANRSRIKTRSQTGNPIRNDRPSCPPITGSGSIPEAQQGRYLCFANYYPLGMVSTKNYSDSFLLSTATTESGVRLSYLGWHLKPISDNLSIFLHFQNAAYLVKKPIQTNNFIQKVEH